MRLNNPLLYVVMIASLGLCSGCMRNSSAVSKDSDGTSPGANAEDVEYKIKERALLKGPAAEAKPLRVIRRIKSEMGGKGEFVHPVSLTVSDNGGVYVSDNNAHLIRYCPADSDSVITLPTQNGRGKLVWPNWIEYWQDSLLVTDNEGIKIFKADGTYQRLIRTFYQIDHFAIGPDGSIYINPSFRNQKTDTPLIVKVDSAGKRVKAFGTRLNSPDTVGLADETYLCAAGEYIFAVFKHRPLIQVYGTGGEIIREININHVAFADLAPLNEDEKFIHPEKSKYRLPKYIAGARAVGERLLVLLDLPQPEVVEFSLDGQELQRYRGSISPVARLYKDFDVQRVGDAYRFWMLLGDSSVMELVGFTTSEGL